MTVLQRFSTDEGAIDLAFNGTSIELLHDGKTYMVRPETLLALLEEEVSDPRDYPSRVALEVWR